MDELNWLAAHRFQEALRDDYSSTFVFDGEVRVNVGCLWRLLEEGSICTTSQDDGHKFGRLAAVDAALEVNQRLAASTSSRQAGSTSSPLGGVAVTSVVLRDGTLDLAFHFATGHVLQLILHPGPHLHQLVNRPRQSLRLHLADVVRRHAVNPHAD